MNTEQTIDPGTGGQVQNRYKIEPRPVWVRWRPDPSKPGEEPKYAWYLYGVGARVYVKARAHREPFRFWISEVGGPLDMAEPERFFERTVCGFRACSDAASGWPGDHFDHASPSHLKQANLSALPHPGGSQ